MKLARVVEISAAYTSSILLILSVSSLLIMVIRELL
jgi:hypothetical protein